MIIIIMLTCLSKCFKKSSPAKEIQGKYMKPILQTDTEANEFEVKEGIIVSEPYGDFAQRFLFNTLPKIFLFRGISQFTLADSFPLFRYLTINPGVEIVTQNSQTNSFYLINSGHCEILVNDQKVSMVSTGYSFGEISLLTNFISRVTVKTIDRCNLWALDKNNFKSIIKSQQLENKNILFSLFKICPFFAQMTENEKESILKISCLVKYLKGEKICEEGENSYFVYFYKSGSSKVTIKGKVVGRLETGQLFGELALIRENYKKRVATITCEEDSEIFIIDIQGFIQVLGPDYKKIILKNIVMNSLLSDNYAKNLNKDHIKEIVNLFQFIELHEGSIAIKSGRESMVNVFVVCFGHIASNNKEFKSYSLIGFQNKNQLKVGTGKYFAMCDSIVAKAPTSEIEKIIGCDIMSYITHLHSLADIQAFRLFNHLELPALEHILDKSVNKDFKKGENIFLEGQHHESVYILIQGSVGIYDSENFIFKMNQGCVFGESCLKFPLREYTARALTSVKCLMISRSDLSNVITPHFSHLVDRSIQNTTSFLLHDVIMAKPITKLNDRDIYLAVNTTNNFNYRCEVIYKKKVYCQAQFQCILNQKCVVAQLEHPHIPRFLRTLSDNSCIYFFYEYYNCENLSSFIVNSKLTELESQFIFINILSCLEYIHSKKILHRNLTPSSILIDSKGYCKLVGFEYAKETFRSQTMLDTPLEYKAKEVIKGQAYTQASEFWSLGIILYQMLTGELPFDIENCQSYNEACDIILEFDAQNIVLNSTSSCKSIVQALLETNPMKRINTKGLIKTPWCSKFNLNEIYHEKVEALFRPKIRIIDDDFGKIQKFKPEKRLTVEDKNNRLNLAWDNFF